MNTPFPAVAFDGVITVNGVDVNTPFSAVAFDGVITVNGVDVNTPFSAVAFDGVITVNGVDVNTPFSAVAFDGVITVNGVDVNTPFPAVAFCGVITVNGSTPTLLLQQWLVIKALQSRDAVWFSLAVTTAMNLHGLPRYFLYVYLRLFRMPLDIFQSGNCARI